MNITVFCGSSNGTDPIYQQTARELGGVFAEQGIELDPAGLSVFRQANLSPTGRALHQLRKVSRSDSRGC